MKSQAIALIIAGGILTVAGPLAGVLVTSFGMMRSFDTLGKSGVADPRALAENIGVSLNGTVIGLCAGAVGVLILIVGVIILAARKPSPPPMPK